MDLVQARVVDGRRQLQLIVQVQHYQLRREFAQWGCTLELCTHSNDISRASREPGKWLLELNPYIG